MPTEVKVIQESSDLVAQLRAQLAVADSRIRELQALVGTDVVKVEQAFRKAEAELATLVAENAELRDGVEALRESVGEAENQLDAAAQRIEELEAQIKESE